MRRYKGQKLVLIENEFGEIGIDGGFLKDAGIQVTEMNSGCICCTLVGDFPQGARRRSCDAVRAPTASSSSRPASASCPTSQSAVEQRRGRAHRRGCVTVVDAGKCRMYMRNFGEFFNDQVENAGSHRHQPHRYHAPKPRSQTAADMLREH